MHITFGTFLDGSEYSPDAASLDVAVYGPTGLLRYLEGRLGLSGVEPTLPERINAYKRKILQLKKEDRAWCENSFRQDPWSTAKQLLAWRDDLIESGCDLKIQKRAFSKREATLRAVEATKGPLPPGVPDRLYRVLKHLKKAEHIQFDDRITLSEMRGILPNVWQKILREMEFRGAEVIAPEPAPCIFPDETHVYTGADEMTLALHLARYLINGENKKTALICESDSTVLDLIFHRFGLGALGISTPSSVRKSLLLLPLFLSLLWEPFSPSRFLTLCLFDFHADADPAKRNALFDPFAAQALADAIMRHPGIHGEEWKKAWSKIAAHFADIPEKGATYRFWRDFFEHKAFKYKRSGKGVTVPGEAVCDFCTALETCIADQIGVHPELALTREHLKTLKTILADQERISPVELAHMLDSIISTGTPRPDAEPEVNSFFVARHPGQILRDFDTVIWWNFTERPNHRAPAWDMDETDSAATAEYYSFSRTCQSEAWHNAVRHARKRLLLFTPEKVAGTEVMPHPLLDEWTAASPGHISEPVEETIQRNGLWRMADRTCQLQPKVPEAGFSTPIQRLPVNSIAARRKLSYSQMNTFLTCPFQWLLREYVGLKCSTALNIPQEKMMIGTFAHKIVEELFKIRTDWTPEAAREKIFERFDALQMQMAADLKSETQIGTLERTRTLMCESIVHLIEIINSHHLTVIDTEYRPETIPEFNGNLFTGFIDIYLKDANGKPFVIDMKWSTSKKYQQACDTNTALQLATYAWMLDPENLEVNCAYYLFPDKNFIFKKKKENDEGFAVPWTRANAMWQKRMNVLHAGGIECGLDSHNDAEKAILKQLEKQPDALPLGAYCAGCEYNAVCTPNKEGGK